MIAMDLFLEELLRRVELLEARLRELEMRLQSLRNEP
jgi:hypothetical protein